MIQASSWSLALAVLAAFPVQVLLFRSPCPIPDAVTAIFVDASETNCGAVLQQKHGDAWKPLAFFSQTFSQTQRSYSTFDRELLAIYLAIRPFRYFVDGRQFIVYANHGPYATPFSHVYAIHLLDNYVI